MGCGKARYVSRRVAKAALRRVHQYMKRDMDRMHVYRCDVCVGGPVWHIGHRPEWKRLARMREHA